ncbi:MAG: hypothetical protein M3Z22_06490 [Verrucomicrobiota bacterium]|nr:hypothetical protein [Verrucomicrobiota bacterium]
MHTLIFFAILLVVLWVVARVFLAMTSLALHLLWIVAVICGVVWLARRLAM